MHARAEREEAYALGGRKRRASDYARVASEGSFLAQRRSRRVGKRTSKLVSTTRMGFVGALLMVAGWVCMLAGLACALAWVLQDRFLYMPLVPGVISNRDPRDNEDPSLQSPVFYGLEFEEVFIQTPTPGVELHAWIIFAPAQGPPKRLPTVLFLHGNAGNIGHRLPFAEDVVLYGNCNIMLVDYRGFGRSTGAPSEEGLIEDGMSALSYLRECPDVDPENIFLMGRSLGGAVSIALASKLATRAGLDLGFRGLILENTFLSVPTLVRDHIRDTLSLDRGLMQELCTGAVNTVVWLDWNSASRIKALPEQLDVLLISGVLDEIVPSSHMTKLYALAGPNVVKTLLRIPGGDHNFSWARPGYFRGLKAFLHEKAKSSVPSSDSGGSQPLSVEK